MEKGTGKRRNFIIQGGTLAIAGLIARALGIIRRVPLTNLIGDVGNGYYSAAYEVYAILLLISSYSLPLAVSKLVAARIERGQYRNANKIFKGALIFAVISGGLACVITLLFADFLAGTVMSEPRSALALRVLAPTLLIVAVMGVFRGYFQGLKTMTPTGISQIIEQIFVVVFSLIGADIAFNKGELFSNLMMNDEYSASMGAAGATIGCGIGALVALGFLFFVFQLSKSKRKKMESRDTTRQNEKYGQITRLLIVTFVPILFSTLIYNISGILDQSIYNHYMTGLGQEALKTFNWGVYSGKYRVLISMPIALASAMCSSLVPAISGSIANHDMSHAKEKISTAIRATMIVIIPCTAGMIVLAKPLITVLFSGEIDLAVKMLYFGSVSIIFLSLSTLGNGILQASGKMQIPVINACIALVIHLGTFWLMLTKMELGIYSVVYSNIIFAVVLAMLNMIAIIKTMHYRQEWKRTFLIPLICSLIMSIVVLGFYFLFHLFLPLIVNVILIILIGMLVYGILIIVLRGVNEYELQQLPGGNIIFKLCKLVKLI